MYEPCDNFARILVAATSVLFLALTTFGDAFSGPFGLEMGQSIEGLDVAPMDANGLYLTHKPPKPHSAFAAYAILVSPSSGLCQIRAISKPIHTSAYGTEFKTKFESIESQIDRVYGKHDRHDLLRSGSIWNEPDEWMTALRKQERVLQTSWNASSGSNLKDGITQILLTASASSKDEGIVVLQYSFENTETCQDHFEKEESDAL